MFKNERQHQIYKILSERTFASVCELGELLYTSESSIRRDLAQMENEGLVKREWGGACAVGGAESVLPFRARSYRAVDEKRAIAQKAITLIKEGDVVFLDQSSTSYFLALSLMNYSNLTVVSNNIEILILLSHTNITVHSTGGVISRKNRNCLIGNNAQRTFTEIYADHAFFSANALSADGVITDCTEEEIFVRCAMLNNAAQKIFLCDGSKIDKLSVYKQCSIAEVDIAISDNDGLLKYKDMFPSLTVL